VAYERVKPTYYALNSMYYEHTYSLNNIYSEHFYCALNIIYYEHPHYALLCLLLPPY